MKETEITLKSELETYSDIPKLQLDYSDKKTVFCNLLKNGQKEQNDLNKEIQIKQPELQELQLKYHQLKLFLDEDETHSQLNILEQRMDDSVIIRSQLENCKLFLFQSN